MFGLKIFTRKSLTRLIWDVQQTEQERMSKLQKQAYYDGQSHGIGLGLIMGKADAQNKGVILSGRMWQDIEDIKVEEWD